MAAVALAAGAQGQAQTQAWPSQPIRWIVPASPRDINDVAARLLAPELAKILAQPVVV